MAVDIDEIGRVYDAFELKAVGTMQKLFDTNVIQSKDKASVISNTINNILQTSAQMVQRQPSLDQQLDEAKLGQAARVANLTKQGVILDKQASKLDKDILMTEAQTAAITQQVIDNRQIKVMATLGDTYSTMAANQLTVNSDMWTFFFNMIHKLESTVSIPASMAITKVT